MTSALRGQGRTGDKPSVVNDGSREEAEQRQWWWWGERVPLAASVRRGGAGMLCVCVSGKGIERMSGSSPHFCLLLPACERRLVPGAPSPLETIMLLLLLAGSTATFTSPKPKDANRSLSFVSRYTPPLHKHTHIHTHRVSPCCPD